MKQLYIEGHRAKAGYVVSLALTDAPPVRTYRMHPNKVRAIVARFNRMQQRRTAQA